MVPRKSRLPREEFRARGYRTFSGRFFLVKAKNNELAENRIGVVVGKSVDKRAVRRNFLERRVKMQLLTLPASGKDIVFTIFPPANQLSDSDFSVEIKKILKTASL